MSDQTPAPKDDGPQDRRENALSERTVGSQPAPADLMERSSGEDAPRASTDLRRPMFAGLVLIGLGAAAFIAWGVLAPLQSAAIAPGTVIVEGNRKTVQHLEGGIVAQVHVRDGARVESGQALYTLDDTLARTRLEQLDIQFVNALARRDRLLAERKSASQITFFSRLLDRVDEDTVREAIVLQTDFLSARLGSLEGQRQVLEQQILQAEEEIRGFQARIESDRVQARLVDEQIASNSILFKKGLVRRSQMAA
ncbi:MAG: biotin/lipoyl-binding protein, partial [Pseudomonadota bacterium]